MRVTRGVWFKIEGEHKLVRRFLHDIVVGRLPLPIYRGSTWPALDGIQGSGCERAFTEGDAYMVDTWIANARREGAEDAPTNRRARR